MRRSSSWTNLLARNLLTLNRVSTRIGTRFMKSAMKVAVAKRKPRIGTGDWLAGVAVGPTGVRRFRIFRPPGIGFGERLPLMVMLHGCHQDGQTVAASTRMNVVAARERFLVLYPEQDRRIACRIRKDAGAGLTPSQAAPMERRL